MPRNSRKHIQIVSITYIYICVCMCTYICIGISKYLLYWKLFISLCSVRGEYYFVLECILNMYCINKYIYLHLRQFLNLHTHFFFFSNSTRCILTGSNIVGRGTYDSYVLRGYIFSQLCTSYICLYMCFFTIWLFRLSWGRNQHWRYYEVSFFVFVYILYNDELQTVIQSYIMGVFGRQQFFNKGRNEVLMNQDEQKQVIKGTIYIPNYQH
eukprot:TRINITY_DN4602_c1_g1_i1.p2 TRINITY_DN4602_c1_g1~~TRINITY_DN4602_c1_g1_i1.p2  ORF type:complete len:211 (+),score=-18.28 TRINITY_DN4602_c1_g1_i1:249-881(+)